MTNAELIAKIKTEIERRWKDYRNSVTPDQPKYRTHYFVGKGEVCEELLSFLDTLEEPVCEELEEAAKNYENSLDYHHYTGDNPSVAFIAGAKWQAEQLLKSSPLPEDTVLFNKGVAEGRRLERDEFEKNRLTACGNQTKEEYDRETDFALGIIKKEHRQPTFSDAINYGMRLQKEQDDKELSDLLTIAHLQGAEQMKEQMLKDGNVILAEEDFEAEKEKSMEWGYNLCKEQMMKEAVEGDVFIANADYKEAIITIVVENTKLDYLETGDKVRVIVLSKDDEK